MYTFAELRIRPDDAALQVNAGQFAYGGMDWTVDDRSPAQYNWGDQTDNDRSQVKRFVFFERLLQGLEGHVWLKNWVYRSYYRK